MSMMYTQHSLEEDRLWIEASKRDVRHFEALYEKYFALIYRYIFRRTVDDALASDLCSTTFYQALIKIKKFEWQGKPFAAWLYRIAQNEINKHYRNRKHIFLIEEDKLTEIPTFEAHWKQLNLEILNNELVKLNELDLQLIELKFFEGLTFSEISILLDLGESAVKMKLYRLLNKLKTNLETQYAKI